MDEMTIRAELRTALKEVSEAGHLKPGSQIVIGCSTSEVSGGVIGKASVPELGRVIAETVIGFCREQSLQPVFQCCEHLNRALVTEESNAEKKGYTRVCAVPKPKAGGSVAAAAWKLLQEPVLVETVRAEAGLDIGNTLIGMHLARVAVPFRGSVKRIGEAPLVMAYTRLPYIGGERARYTEDD